MEDDLPILLEGYKKFREKYAAGDGSVMDYLNDYGQSPKTMVVACSDSRVDPALILQCRPGDLFVSRNVAAIVPPYEKGGGYHGTSSALEFGIRFLEVGRLIILGHSGCGGIEALLKGTGEIKTDFIKKWVSIVENPKKISLPLEEYVKYSIDLSYKNCLTFPWVKERIAQGKLSVSRWFFEIKSGRIFSYSEKEKDYIAI